MQPRLLLALALASTAATVLATPSATAAAATPPALRVGVRSSPRLLARHGDDEDDEDEDGNEDEDESMMMMDDDLDMPDMAHAPAPAPAHEMHDSDSDSSSAAVPAASSVPTTAAAKPPHHSGFGGMHMTMQHGPKDELNETAILLAHGPDPMSFYEYDYESDASAQAHPGWMIAHGAGMFIAFTIVLPVGLALKTAQHPLFSLVNVAFLVLIALSTLCATIYKKITPDLYGGSAHGPMGWFTLVLIAALTSLEALRFSRRFLAWFRSTSGSPRNWSTFVSSVLSSRPSSSCSCSSSAPYSALAEEWTPEPDHAAIRLSESRRPSLHVRFPSDETAHEHENDDRRVESPDSEHSRHSDVTLHDHDEGHTHLSKPPAPALSADRSLSFRQCIAVALKYINIFLDRTTLVLGFALIVTGITSYSGLCRATYKNGCLAHLIKGGIFLGYGLLTFGRFLGAWSEIGWAWNVKPAWTLGTWREKMPSAEFVESFTIFLYGCTNTFMERFGAKAGDAWTMKQVQHASIAVMFFFAGGLGVALESQRVRAFLSRSLSSSTSAPSTTSSAPSANPFPALAIGITGFAMASHHQEYTFAVSQHALFGNFLALFAACRCATYALVHLRPPRSEHPSRPITEALASFFLTGGGIAFMFSIEQFTFAAMRRGFSHLMFLLNLTVSITCWLMFWTLVVLAVKGWAAARVASPEQYHAHGTFRFTSASRGASTGAVGHGDEEDGTRVPLFAAPSDI